MPTLGSPNEPRKTKMQKPIRLILSIAALVLALVVTPATAGSADYFDSSGRDDVLCAAA